MIKVLFGFAALLPLMAGPLSHEEKSLLLELCSGGQISIPLGDEDGKDDHPCDHQACHASTCREKTKRANLI